MADKKTYAVVKDGFLMGGYHAAGTTVDLYPAQAKYDLPPHGDMLAEVVAAPVAPVATAPRRAPTTAKSQPESVA